MKTIKKELSVGDCYKIFGWYSEQINKKRNGEDNILDHLSNLLQWKLHRNISVIQDEAIKFEAYRNALKEESKKEWFNNDKSYYDEESNQKKIKNEYLDEYKSYLKNKLEEMSNILNTKTEYQISVMDVEYEIENIINSLENPDFDEIEVLFFMDESTD